jgi:hypothetical protein
LASTGELLFGFIEPGFERGDTVVHLAVGLALVADCRQKLFLFALALRERSAGAGATCGRGG